jgi:uncharacterized protein
MKCPACGRDLSAMTAGDVAVDVCAGGCAGIWFDDFELAKLEREERSAGNALLQVPRDAAVQVDVTARRSCPKCGVEMMRRFESVERKVTVDECPTCAGMWLDAGELGAIEAEYASDEDRERAAADYFDSFDGQLDEIRAEDQAELERHRRFAHTFRFICPSYYIHGKQAWGAF